MTLVERLEKIVSEINLKLAGSYLNKIQCLSEYDYLFSFSKSKSPSILISLNVKNPFIRITNQKFMFNTSNQFYLRIKNKLLNYYVHHLLYFYYLHHNNQRQKLFRYYHF